MSARLKWTAAAACWYGLILAGQGYAQGPAGLDGRALKLAYGLGFLGVGVTVMGALARWFPRRLAAEWRAAAMVASALLAALAIALREGGGSGQRTDVWVAALLGVGVAALASRGLPAGWVERWLGRADANEKYQGNSD
ncbi:MAG: hypothetical protein HY942_08475 [Gammaproteobacteria bacterium]|nr:hypothetical protein [Gammaproteobacteria bacterium]